MFPRSLANSQRSLAVFESCYEPQSLNVQVRVGCFPPFFMTLTCAASEKQLSKKHSQHSGKGETLQRDANFRLRVLLSCQSACLGFMKLSGA